MNSKTTPDTPEQPRKKEVAAGAQDVQSQDHPQSTAGAAPSEQNAAGTADFERSLAELEAIVDKLEQGDLTLEESLRQFERGVQLTRVCQRALRQAEQKVEILMRRNGGAPDEYEAAPFEPSDNDRNS